MIKLKEDKKAKSKSFFLNSEKDFFKKKHIIFLQKFYKKFKKDIRICLHKNSKSRHHDMIILQQKKNFYKPHKHSKKGETYHIIKGSMICVIFKDSGKIEKTCIIKKNDIFRTPLNKYHTMMPLTNYVIYHESKPGPFLKKNDSIFPKWNKKFEDKKQIEILKEKSIKIAKN
tara:strand:- start:746 stop:1261 length:516 start_codon:yes stop_codon:yes gene_type:complete